jgi:ElaB/YqjD/DUF883 family membrane-anchored ribosome-binding protein
MTNMAISKSIQDLRDMARSRIDEVEEAGASIGHRFSDAAHTVADAADRARQTGAVVARRANRGVHDVQDQISHHPLTAAFLAIGAGFLLAAITLRRR